jgi:uncharacterized protein
MWQDQQDLGVSRQKTGRMSPKHEDGMLRWFEYGRIYHPDREWVASGAEVGHPWEDFYFQATDGVQLNGWFFPALRESSRSHMALLICHGNAGNISHRVKLCRVLLKTGLNVLVFDYRGYGRSGGKLSEEGTYCDAEGAHLWLQERGLAAANILVFGESLGGGVGSELALRRELGGLILHSTFTSIADIGAELYPWLPVRWLHTIKYDTRSKLPLLKAPVLVIHSRNDGMIRFHHAERNFAAANPPKLFWEVNGGHDYSLCSEQDRCFEGIEKFLALVEAREVARESS